MQVPEEIINEFRPTDNRGRVTLGSDYKNKKVKLAVLEVEDKENRVKVED